MFDPIVNHSQQAIDRLMGQYANATNLKNLITALVNPIQEIEDALTDMNVLRQLAIATGINLDNLGKIIGLERTPGDSDAVYRNKLYAEVKVNTSEGQPEQAIQTYQLFTAANLVLLFEHFPAEISIESDYVVPDQATVDLLLGILQKVLPTGVRCDSLITFDPTMAFAFDGSLSGLGFDDDDNPGFGGLLPTEFTRNTFFEFAGDDVNGAGFGSDDDPLVGGWFDNI